MNFFSFNFALREFFFLYFARPPPPPHKFSNGPSLKRISVRDIYLERGRYVIYSPAARSDHISPRDR